MVCGCLKEGLENQVILVTKKEDPLKQKILTLQIDLILEEKYYHNFLMFQKINRINIPSQITYTILPLGLIIMGDSILYVILPSNYDFFEIESFLGIDIY